MQKVAAMVLAGGRNEGFGVLTLNRAKAALPYAGQYRLIDFALSSLSDSGIDWVGLIIQYLPGSLLDHVGTGQAWDYYGDQRRLKIMPPFVGVRDTEWYGGSADALRRNLSFVRPHEGTDVIICSGEHVYAMDFSDVVGFHRACGADLTIVAKRIAPEQESDRLGRLEFDEETRRVRRFVEKPPRRFTNWASIGVYVFRGQVLERALEESEPGKIPTNLPKDVVEPVSREGRSFAYVFDGPWEYLEDLGQYYRSHRRLLAGDKDYPSPVWEARTNLLDRGLCARVAARFGPDSEVSGAIVSPGCQIFGRVVDSALSPGVYVAPGAEVRQSILLHDCRVEAGALIHRAVSDKDAVFEPGCRIGLSESAAGPNPLLPPSAQDLAVIGKGARIGPGVQLPLGAQVYPKAVIELTSQALAEGQLNLEAGAAGEKAGIL